MQIGSVRNIIHSKSCRDIASFSKSRGASNRFFLFYLFTTHPNIYMSWYVNLLLITHSTDRINEVVHIIVSKRVAISVYSASFCKYLSKHFTAIIKQWMLIAPHAAFDFRHTLHNGNKVFLKLHWCFFL